MLRCREIVRLAAAGGLRGRSLRERIGFGVHIVVCGYCREYVRSLRRLRATARQVWQDVPGMDPARRDRIRSRLPDI